MASKKVYIFNDIEYDSLYNLRKDNPMFVFPDASDDKLKSFGIDVHQKQIINKALTDSELKDSRMLESKIKRMKDVSKIEVSIDGMTFNGDEKSQERMSKTIIAYTNSGESLKTKVKWVLADGTIAEPTISQLIRALRLSCSEQTRLWVLPYNKE